MKVLIYVRDLLLTVLLMGIMFLIPCFFIFTIAFLSEASDIVNTKSIEPPIPVAIIDVSVSNNEISDVVHAYGEGVEIIYEK